MALLQQQETKVVLKSNDALDRLNSVGGAHLPCGLIDNFLLLRCRRCLQVGCGWGPSGCSWANGGERNVNTHRFYFWMI